MRLSLLCMCLTALVMATPALAQTSPSPAPSTHPKMETLVSLPIIAGDKWNSLSTAEKKALISGVLEGIAADGLMHGLLGGEMPVDKTTADLFNFCATHQDDLIAFVDKANANPKHYKVGLRALVIGFFLQKNPDYNKRMLSVAQGRLTQLEQHHPDWFHSPAPSPLPSK